MAAVGARRQGVVARVQAHRVAGQGRRGKDTVREHQRHRGRQRLARLVEGVIVPNHSPVTTATATITAVSPPTATAAATAAAGITHAATSIAIVAGGGGSRQRSCPPNFFKMRVSSRSSCPFLPARGSSGHRESHVRSPWLFAHSTAFVTNSATTAATMATAPATHAALAPAATAKPLFARLWVKKILVAATVPPTVTSAASDGPTAISIYTRIALHSSTTPPTPPLPHPLRDIPGKLQCLIDTVAIAATDTATANADVDAAPAAPTSGGEVVVGDGRKLRASEEVERAEGRQRLHPTGAFLGLWAGRDGDGALRSLLATATTIAAISSSI